MVRGDGAVVGKFDMVRVGVGRDGFVGFCFLGWEVDLFVKVRVFRMFVFFVFY